MAPTSGMDPVPGPDDADESDPPEGYIPQVPLEPGQGEGVYERSSDLIADAEDEMTTLHPGDGDADGEADDNDDDAEDND